MKLYNIFYLATSGERRLVTQLPKLDWARDYAREHFERYVIQDNETGEDLETREKFKLEMKLVQVC